MMMWIVMIIIPVVVFGSAVVIKRKVRPETELGAWANVASIVGGIATADLAPLGSYTFFESARFQRTFCL